MLVAAPAQKFYVLNVTAVEFVPVSSAGHPASSRTAKNDVSSGHPTAMHSAVAANTMHSGIHCSCKLVIAWSVDSTHHFFLQTDWFLINSYSLEKNRVVIMNWEQHNLIPQLFGL